MRSNNLDIRIAGSSCRPQLQTRDSNTVEVLISGHPWDAEKVPVTEAGGRLRKCKNTEFVWEFRKKGGSLKAAVIRAVRLRECPLGVLPLLT